MLRSLSALLLFAVLACATRPGPRLDPSLPISAGPTSPEPTPIACEGLARKCPEGYRCVGNVCDLVIEPDASTRPR